MIVSSHRGLLALQTPYSPVRFGGFAAEPDWSTESLGRLHLPKPLYDTGPDS
jgi:hypothetical protein